MFVDIAEYVPSNAMSRICASRFGARAQAWVSTWTAEMLGNASDRGCGRLNSSWIASFRGNIFLGWCVFKNAKKRWLVAVCRILRLCLDRRSHGKDVFGQRLCSLQDQDLDDFFEHSYVQCSLGRCSLAVNCHEPFSKFARSLVSVRDGRTSGMLQQ